MQRFIFRNIKQDETDQANTIEQICFPPHEACSEKSMVERIRAAEELFLVAVDEKTGKIAGFLNGIATDETSFRDEFFTDAGLYDPEGRNVMLLGLDVLPEYRGQGLARFLLDAIRRDMAQLGIPRLYLITEHEHFYEKCGWQFYTMVKEDSGALARMYMAETLI